MKKLVFAGIVVASMMLPFMNNNASANLLVGPAPIGTIGAIGGSTNSTQPSTWGLQFTANQTSHLVGFDFNQKGSIFGTDNAGTISLKDVTTSTTVDTWSVPVVPGFAPVAGTVSFTGDDILKSGDTYQLVYTQTAGSYSNEAYAYVYGTGFAPYTNSDITVTNGVENDVPSSGVWYAFGNISTVPEPSTFAMLGLGGLVLAIRRRRAAA